MQPCNIATGAACHYANAAGTFPPSKISCSGVGVSQHNTHVMQSIYLNNMQCSHATLLQVPHATIQTLLVPSQLARYPTLELG